MSRAHLSRDEIARRKQRRRRRRARESDAALARLADPAYEHRNTFELLRSGAVGWVSPEMFERARELARAEAARPAATIINGAAPQRPAPRPDHA